MYLVQEVQLLRDNTVSNNSLSGVRLDNSGNSVTDNSIVGNGVGVSIYAAKHSK